MTDYANSSSELSVASRASQYHGISWWPIGIGIAFSAFSFSFTDSLFFIESCSFVDETFTVMVGSHDLQCQKLW